LRLFLLTRHAHSTLNVEGRVNGDPGVPVPLTPEGRAEAERLGHQVAQIPLDLCVHTRFGRTLETADIALGGREVPRLGEPLLDDIDVGDLEGETIAAYRAWKRGHRRSDPFPGGESLDDAARRYARAFRRLVDRHEQCVLVVCHEIPVRYALNAAAGSDDLDAPEHSLPNATPYLFEGAALARAVQRIEELTRLRKGVRNMWRMTTSLL
jgi:broad specificity phosphatase PhoE